MSYIICFWDKSKIQVTDKTGEKLKEVIKAGEAKTFELSNSLYSIAGVEKIIPKYDAFEVFPTENEYLKDMTNSLTKEEDEEWDRLEQKEKMTLEEARKYKSLTGVSIAPERIDQKLLS